MYELSEEYAGKGRLSPNRQEQAGMLLMKDSETERLLYLNQTEPDKLTAAQKAYLDRELRAIAASYNIPVEQLYNLDLSNTIKRDDSALKAYLASRNALKNSYDMQQAQSLKEGLEFAAIGQGALATPKVLGETAKTIKAIDSVVSNSTKLALGVGTAGSIGSQLLTEGTVDPKVLAIDLGTVYITKGRGFVATVGTNAASGGLSSYVTDKSVSDGAISSGLGSSIGYGLGKLIQIPLDNKLNPNANSYLTESLNNKVPYIEVYRRSVVPSLFGSAAGEAGSRGFQEFYNDLNRGESSDKK